VTATSATLNGTVNANGTSCVYFFEYGPTNAYGTSTVSYSTSANSSVAITATGLTENTTYHFRLVATNGNGTSYGVDRTFVTSASSGASPQQSGGGGGGGGGCFVNTAGNDVGPTGSINIILLLCGLLTAVVAGQTGRTKAAASIKPTR
jgi:hypothetical protein